MEQSGLDKQDLTVYDKLDITVN